ncbi:hypothetical protein FYK55_00900 [Roseiconus nitratireducens]|uniref:Uncharacterized protein n=1 Tax=Roseiconus nitratireducens TaxID=2605748 RepID=A0A5M6DHI9_9BACT|nr:hypothetical protein [Roseiconus nitratireducens]KAA5547008.1 hypothetical protein FYK55_00900 [Roseiconus nitratireducens]
MRTQFEDSARAVKLASEYMVAVCENNHHLANDQAAKELLLLAADSIPGLCMLSARLSVAAEAAGILFPETRSPKSEIAAVALEMESGAESARRSAETVERILDFCKEVVQDRSGTDEFLRLNDKLQALQQIERHRQQCLRVTSALLQSIADQIT